MQPFGLRVSPCNVRITIPGTFDDYDVADMFDIFDDFKNVMNDKFGTVAQRKVTG